MSYCQNCDRPFPHSRALNQHLRNSSVAHPHCRPCDESFSSERELANHNDEQHYYCRECNRLFRSAANLDAHRASSTHVPRVFVCPGRLCGRAFVSISALILHAESGTCKSGVTRQIVNAQMRRIDRQNVITNPARMIGGGSEPEYWATERSWNGHGYECFLCQAEFRALRDLNRHLQSPRHLQPLYHCPKRGCNMRSSVLSAVCQHVEWGPCGARQMRLVHDTIESLTRGMRAIAF